MAHLHKVIFILIILFFSVNAKPKKERDGIFDFNPNPLGDYDENNPLPTVNDVEDAVDAVPGVKDVEDAVDAVPGVKDVKDAVHGVASKAFEMVSLGHWEIINPNAGVSAMHIGLLHTNKLIVYDAKIYRTSRIKLPDGEPCLPYEDLRTKEQKQDCFAHSVEYDIETNQVRPLVQKGGDAWCSSGGFAVDGTLVSSGGFLDGGKTLRYIGGGCQNCEWREYDNTLTEDRWYGTQQRLPGGDHILVGGRKAFSYEFIPAQEGKKNGKSHFFPFLYETSDLDENNLYPFVHLSTDGNLFIFSNNRSLLLSPTTQKIIRTFPVLPGGSRNYPASGMSALLPIDLNAGHINNLKAEVIICGGNVPGAYILAEQKKAFLPALQDCNRLTITEPRPEWKKEMMPSKRTMGDALILPNGELLFINGAQLGTAAWWDAEDPNYTPVIYDPEKPQGSRFKNLKPSQIARMYHSTSALLPNGKIWVGGSNTHDGYRDNDKYPTETRVEAFSPPYLNENFDKHRPKIDEAASETKLKYGAVFETQFSVEAGAGLTTNDIKVTMYSPPFTTHGTSMGQRLLVLKIDDLVEEAAGTYKVTSAAPPSGVIAPPGYYLLFVVHRGIPAATGMWVHIQ